MTCRSYTCSSLILALASAAALPGATVHGKLRLADSQMVVVAKLKDYSGVAVWLEPVAGKAPTPAPRAHTIVQKGKRFIPHISVVSTGTLVDWPNRDPIFHNAFSNFAGMPFDTGLYPPGGTQKIRFQREGVVRVFCNIHSTMSAVIVVVNTPWFASSGPDGAFRIEGVPPGDYTLRVWHERASEAVLKAAERRITVIGDSLELSGLVVSESGFVQTPHKNKYGKEYAPEPPDRVPYSSAHR